MPHPSNDVPAVDHRCTSYGPGHQVHFIHARKSWEDERSIDVLAVVQSDGLIRLEWPDEVVVRWHHDARRLAAALRRTGGFARWKSGWHALAVPSGPGGNLLFNLAAPQQAAVCGASRVAPSAAR
ncbi:hypothetical protein [Rhodococcus sp. NPDC003348]